MDPRILEWAELSDSGDDGGPPIEAAEGDDYLGLFPSEDEPALHEPAQEDRAIVPVRPGGENAGRIVEAAGRGVAVTKTMAKAIVKRLVDSIVTAMSPTPDGTPLSFAAQETVGDINVEAMCLRPITHGSDLCPSVGLFPSLKDTSSHAATLRHAVVGDATVRVAQMVGSFGSVFF